MGVYMITDYQKIRDGIENAIQAGKRNFIIYPFGEYGMLTKQILNGSFGIEECYIIDNKLSKFNPNIKNLDYCKTLDNSKYTLLFICANPDIYEEVYHCLKDYFPQNCIVELFPQEKCRGGVYTRCGKYSYGPLCSHWLVEEVGAFCSFAPGSDVVENHPVQYISTHAFMYCDKNCSELIENYEQYKDRPWYFSGIVPKAKVHKYRRIIVGNDVWFGRNVLVTNSSNIGNGVIAAAGAIITKDVPDYAVVAGVPAQIIRYRYTPKQIEALNKIAWWNWSDEKIRECYDDLFEDINYFIGKYEVK